MSHEDPKTRAAEASHSDEHGTILRLLLESLQDPNPRARILAIRDLSDYHDQAVITQMIAMADQDPDQEVRSAAVSALGDLVYAGSAIDYDDAFERSLVEAGELLAEPDYQRICDFLHSVYADESRTLDERCRAVESLSHRACDEVEDLIAELYARPEREAKIGALLAMGWNGASRWEEILRQEIANPDTEIQVEAIHSAGQIGVRDLGKDLWRLTYSDDKEIALTAIWALGQTGWEGAFERLDELTLDPDPQIRECADEAMEEWLFYNGLMQDLEQGGPDRFLDDL